MSPPTWKQSLSDRMDTDWAREIDLFERQIELRQRGKLDEKVFAETRLRRGVYGQRYDNGRRHDGIAERALAFDAKPTKGPDTLWDAPGMQRIKLPYGGLSPDQMGVLAALADEYSDALLHVTTRQDFQLHYVHIEDTPDLMRRLAAVGITTREACGNSVRNVTAFVARQRADARGFLVVVGGGLGAVPHQAKVLSEFTPEEELLPFTQAVCRVYARLGEKKNRGRALVAVQQVEAGASAGLRFATGKIELRFVDQLAAPNTREAYESVCKEIRPVAIRLFGASGFELAHVRADDPREMLTVTLSALSAPGISGALDASALLERLGGVRTE